MINTKNTVYDYHEFVDFPPVIKRTYTAPLLTALLLDSEINSGAYNVDEGSGGNGGLFS